MTGDGYTLKSHDWILLFLMTLVFVYGATAFFVNPKDPETVKAIIALFVLVITNLVTYKATAHQAQVQAGTTQATVTVAPPEDKAGA